VRSVSHGQNKESFLEKILWFWRLKKISKHLPTNPIIADLGCGFNCLALQKLTPKIHTGVGVDLKVASFKNGKIQSVEANLNKNLPLKNNFFDVVITLAVIEHLNNPLNFCREIYRILKPGGCVILTTPTPRAKPILEFLAFKLKIISAREIADHKNYFSPKDIIQLFQKVGFTKKNMRVKTFQLGCNLFFTAKK